MLQIFTIHYRSQKNKFSLISFKNRHSKQFPDSTAANSPIHVQEPVKSTVIPSSIHVCPYRGRDGLQLKDKSNYSGHLVSLRLPLITVKSNYRQHHVFLTKKYFNCLSLTKKMIKQTIQKLCNFNLLHSMTLTDCSREKNYTEFWWILFILVDMGQAFPLPAESLIFHSRPNFRVTILQPLQYSYVLEQAG